jgi:ribonuclease HII
MARRPTACDQPALFGRDAVAAGPGALEGWARAHGYRLPAGVDEAGRGPLAGPVVAAAVLLDGGRPIDGLNDSKKLSADRRLQLALLIRERAAAVGLGVVGPQQIDASDIRRAALAAMTAALGELWATGGRPDVVLVDGLDPCPLPPLPASSPPIRVRAFTQGDGRSLAIAAASIIAKVHRDALMDGYHRRWPQYGFDQHKGYGTAAHRRALKTHGPCPIHRRSFNGVLGESSEKADRDLL